MIVEEHGGTPQSARPGQHADGAESSSPPLVSHAPAWESEVCILEADSPAELLQRSIQLASFVESVVARDEVGFSLEDLAFSLSCDFGRSPTPYRLAIVATSLDDLKQKLARATERLAQPSCRQIKDVSGIYYASEPLGRKGKLAFMFPGEGAQYPNMLADLCLHFPEVRACFDRTDRLLRGHSRGYLPSDYIFA